MNKTEEPVNVFRSNMIRPKDLENNTSIFISPTDQVIIDGCENIEHLVIEPEKVAQKLNVWGPFPEHLTIEGRFKKLRLGGSMNIDGWEPFIGNWTRGLICNHLRSIHKTPDIMVMAFPQSDDGVLRIGPEYCGRTLAIRGTSTVKQIIIQPEKQMNHIVIQSMEWLEEIVLKGRVTQLEIRNTPKLKKISGYGDFLTVRTNCPYNTPALDINGFWRELDVTNQECTRETFILSEKDLKNLDDLQGKIVYCPDYSIACKWAEILNVNIDETVSGTDLNTLVDLWSENEKDAEAIFDDWLGDERFGLERKYFGMRIAMVLLFRGEKKKAIRVRNIALTGIRSNRLIPQNTKPLVYPERTLRWRLQNFSSISNSSEMGIFAPYDILDLEFLSRAFTDKEMPPILGELDNCIQGVMTPIEWMEYIDEKRDFDFSKVLLELCKSTLRKINAGNQNQNWPNIFDETKALNIIYCLERLNPENINRDLIVGLAEAIEDSSIHTPRKAGLIIALMQIKDLPVLQIFLERQSGSLDLNFSLIVHNFSVKGCEATLRSLGIKKFQYPYRLEDLR